MHADLIEIGRVHGAADFALLTGAFEAVDIPICIFHDQMVLNYSHASLALDGALIAVPRSHEKEALAYLHSVIPRQHSGVSMWFLLSIGVLFVLFGSGCAALNATFARRTKQDVLPIVRMD
jgi:hypothetical protein